MRILSRVPKVRTPRLQNLDVGSREGAFSSPLMSLIKRISATYIQGERSSSCIALELLMVALSYMAEPIQWEEAGP